MRIVHVVQCLGMGGQERLILNLSRELIRRGHEAAVVSLTPGGDLRPEFDPIATYDAPRVSGFDPRVMTKMVALLRRLRPDVVHTHNPSPMFYATPPARLLGIRAVHTKHGANVYGPRSIWAARAVVRTLAALVAVSEPTAAVARTKERVPERLLHVIPNGIPLSQFGPDEATRVQVRDELKIPRDAFVVGSVGRLAKEKDYPMLVRAMRPLLSEKVRLVLVGEGNARREIEGAIDESIKPFVTLTGARRDVPRFLAAMDLFALSSKTEGLPLVIPEAMACALPVVATSVGGLPSVVPQDVGSLVPSEDPEPMRNAIQSLEKDREKLRRMGEAARTFALAKFSIETMTDAYEKLYAPRVK